MTSSPSRVFLPRDPLTPINVTPNRGIHIASANPCRTRADASLASVEIVSIVVAVLAPGVTVLGDNLQVLPVGSPEHVIWIALLNVPPCGITFNPTDADCPAGTVSAAVELEMILKSGAATGGGGVVEIVSNNSGLKSTLMTPFEAMAAV